MKSPPSWAVLPEESGETSSSPGWAAVSPSFLEAWRETGADAVPKVTLGVPVDIAVCVWVSGWTWVWRYMLVLLLCCICRSGVRREKLPRELLGDSLGVNVAQAWRLVRREQLELSS